MPSGTPLQPLPLLTAFPNAEVHLVRYYGWYCNVSRGKRQKVQREGTDIVCELNELPPSMAQRAWARLIKQV